MKSRLKEDSVRSLVIMVVRVHNCAKRSVFVSHISIKEQYHTSFHTVHGKIEASSNAVKSNIAKEPGMLGP